MITENKCGLAVPPENFEAFADTLEYMADNRDKAAEMGGGMRAVWLKEILIESN